MVHVKRHRHREGMGYYCCYLFSISIGSSDAWSIPIYYLYNYFINVTLYFISDISINHVIECLEGTKHSTINYKLLLIITLNLEIVVPKNN